MTTNKENGYKSKNLFVCGCCFFVGKIHKLGASSKE